MVSGNSTSPVKVQSVCNPSMSLVVYDLLTTFKSYISIVLEKMCLSSHFNGSKGIYYAKPARQWRRGEMKYFTKYYTFNSYQITKLPISTTSAADFKVVVKEVKAVCQAAPLPYCIFTSHTGFTKVIPHCAKVLSYILYDGPITWHRIGQEFSYRRERERQMQRCQYIMGDGDRFDDWGLTETGLSSSISNLFVSAAILTDKQSACNITSTLTECDSASTRQ